MLCIHIPSGCWVLGSVYWCRKGLLMVKSDEERPCHPIDVMASA